MADFEDIIAVPTHRPGHEPGAACKTKSYEPVYNLASHLEHLISFVKHHNPHTLKLQDALGVQVL